MQLYGFVASPYVARTLLASRWKGCGLELTPPPGGHVKSAEYLAINPLGKMPALEDNGRCLAESTVICEYLDEAQTGRKLLPADPMGRAQARMIARMVDVYVVPHAGGLFRNLNPAARNDAEVQATIAALRKAVADLERFLGAGPWMGGAQSGFADAIAAPTFWVLFELLSRVGVDDLFSGLPKLARWYEAVEADPVSGPLHAEYVAAFRAFLQSRMKAA